MLPSGVPSLANIRFSPYALPNMSNSSGYPISTPSVGWAPDPTLQYSVANSILPNSTSAIQSSITSPSSSSISNPSSQSLNNNLAATLALISLFPRLGATLLATRGGSGKVSFMFGSMVTMDLFPNEIGKKWSYVPGGVPF